MANRPISAGAESFTLWKAETAFGTAVTADTHFGLDTAINPSLNNNLTGRRGFKGSATGGRDILAYTAGKSEGSFSVDFDMCDHTFFTHALGTLAAETYSGIDLPLSFTTTTNFDNVTTDRCTVYAGCVIDQATIKGAEGEPVTCSLNCKYAKSDFTGTLLSNTALTGDAPYTFTEATFELPNATTITNIVNGFELTISNNFTFHYGANRVAQYYTAGERAYSLKLDTKYVADLLLTAALGGTGIAADTPTVSATMEIVLTRPDNDTITFLFGLSPIQTYNLAAQLNNPISESVEIIPATLTVTYS